MTGIHSENAQRQKSRRALKTISEAAELIDVPQHVLRFWETKFPQIKPLKRNGGRRFYRPEDIETLLKIKFLLYKQGYTIKGAKKVFDQKIDDKALEAFANSLLQGFREGASNDNHHEVNGADPQAVQPADGTATTASGQEKHRKIKEITENLKQLSRRIRQSDS